MKRKSLVRRALLLVWAGVLVLSCAMPVITWPDSATPTSAADREAFLTYQAAGNEPTSTRLPPATRVPTVTPEPGFEVGEWMDAHFFSVMVVEASTATSLDGETPLEDTFVIVEVQWKANDLDAKQVIAGIEFQLLDDDGTFYDLSGMIFDKDDFKAFGANAKYDRGGWIESKVTGSGENTYRLVFDVPASATGLKLWFRNMPGIDLGLD